MSVDASFSFSCVGIQPHTRSVNKVVTDQKDLLPTALKYAAEITKNSPDSVRSTKLALLLAKEMGMEESYDKHAETAIAKEVDEGENIKEGLAAFNEARCAILDQIHPNPKKKKTYSLCFPPPRAFYRNVNHDGRTHAPSQSSPPNCEADEAERSGTSTALSGRPPGNAL